MSNSGDFIPSEESRLDRQRLERAQAHLAAIIDSSEDAIVSKTLEGIVTSWNAAAERLFGWSAEEMIGRPILTVIPPDLQHEENTILSKLRAGQRIERYETVRVRKDGELIEVSLTVSPVRDSQGRVVGAAKVAHDITARRRAERALKDREAQLKRLAAEREQFLEAERVARSEAERLSHLKDEFLATLSHELRTPLNAIQGWTTVLLQGALTDDQRQALQTIDRNVRAQSHIINDLLDMNRIIAGKIHLEVQAFHLQDVIHNAAEAVRQSATAKGIRLNLLLDSSIGPTRGDPNRLQQVIWNLLSNAVKFTPQGGRVQVILERVGSQVEIVVEDTGVGIPPDFLPYVFERFRQADASMARRHGGLGLGLSIVKNLVELHGGSVRVKSAGENKGSTFIVALPVSHVQPERAGPYKAAVSVDPPRFAELPTLEAVAVLIVDDEADGRALMARVLESYGARIACAASASEALERLGKERFDILLSDIGMPGMDGYELMGHVRALGEQAHAMPAIAVTAYARAEDRQRSLLAGYHMHLSKPIEPAELVAGIASLLRLAR